MSLLPSRPDAEPAEDAGPRVIGLDDDAADDVLAALSSGTARSLLAALHDEPAPPSELAERCDTSLQNVQYHLEKLENAGAVEVVETAYSEKGREMDVYAPADQPLVVFAGDEDDGSTLRTALKRLLGAVGVLGLASLFIQATLGRFSLGIGLGGSPGGVDGADRAPDLGEGGGGGGGGAPTGAPTDEDVEYNGGGADNATANGDGGATPSPTQDTADPEATRTVAEETETVAETVTETARDTSLNMSDGVVTTTEGARTGVETAAAGGLPPGLVFFAGGLFVLAVVAGVWYLNQR